MFLSEEQKFGRKVCWKKEWEGEKGWVGVFMGKSCKRSKVIRHGTAAGRSRATPSEASARHGPCGRSIFSPMRAFASLTAAGDSTERKQGA
jgi:hypothetical protein